MADEQDTTGAPTSTGAAATGAAATGAAATSGTTAAPRRAVFRTPRSALVAVVFLALCLSPIAFQGGAWFLLFLFPLAVAWWVLRTRTVVDAEGLAVHTAWSTTRWPWSRVATLRLVDRGWVRAVGTGEPAEELALRCIRIRDLGRVGEASGGRISAPTPSEAQAAVEHDRELQAARMRIAGLRERQAAGSETSDDATADDAAVVEASAGAEASEPDHDRGGTSEPDHDRGGASGRTTGRR